MVVLSAPAKVNLSLEIRGKRGDGYFEIRSILAKTTLADTVTISFLNRKREKEFSVTVTMCVSPGFENWVQPSFFPLAEKNLALLAAEHFLQETECGGNVSLAIEKRIPIGGGLGGGSSDAAAVLLGLNQLMGFPLSRKRLWEVGVALGSDVAFFLEECAYALASGRGEKLARLESLPFMHLPLCLYYPGYELSTREVFSHFEKAYPLTTPLPDASIRKNGGLHNALEEVVFVLKPELLKIKEEFARRGAAVCGITGSGSSVFGVFKAISQAQEAADLLSGKVFYLG